MTEDTITHQAMTAPTWRTVRHALSIALIHGNIDQREFDLAMAEVMGTNDKNLW